MWENLKHVLSSNQYIPHGHCYLWQSPLVGLHLSSDLLIAVAYFSIPTLLFYFVQQRSHTPFPRVFVLFGAFILLCGMGHLLEIWTLWQPIYWFSGVEKAMTALVSCYTALQLVELLPQFLSLRTPQELEAINQELQAQIDISTLAHQELQQSEQTLQAIVAGTASVTGEAFFPALVQHLALSLDVPYVLVSELISDQPKTLRTLAFQLEDHTGENFVYELSGTSCECVIEQAALYYCSGQKQHFFPTTEPLKRLNADCYVGMPLFDGNQQVIGVLCIASDRPLSNEENTKAIIKVFAARAAAELLRQRAELALKRAYDELEERVQARTSELVVTNTALAAEIQERVAAETALRQQAKHEQLVGLLTQQIHRTLNLQETLNTTVTGIHQVLQTDRVLIYRLHADGGGDVIVESVSAGWLTTLGTSISDCYFADIYLQLYQQGRIHVVEDIYQASLTPCHTELLAGLQVRANLAVPIVYEERLWGLLVAQQCDAPRQWQAVEIELLQQLATQTAIAIQKSELYEQIQQNNTILDLQVQERTAKLQQALDLEAALKRITDKVRDSLDESQILHTAVQELVQLLQVDYCHTALYDPEQGISTIRFEHGWLIEPEKHSMVQMVDFPDTYPQLLQGQHLQFCWSTPAAFSLLSQHQTTVLITPICDDQGVVGDLWLSHKASRIFDELEIRLVQQVANQCAIAIRQARLYQMAQTQVQELEKLSRLKDDFLSTVSHELRTPMSNIKMAIHMLEIVLKQTGALDSEADAATRYFKILQDECYRETRLINDLLDLTRLDAGTEPLVFTSIDPRLWITHISEPFIERALNQQQQLYFDYAPDLPPITTDITYLGQILAELLHNACKYTPSGEVIWVTVAVTAEEWLLKVSNSGVEISASECERIFDKFYRIPNNDPWKHGGTGLGLALVKKRVERLGGTIQAKCSDGHISFMIKLPIGIHLASTVE